MTGIDDLLEPSLDDAGAGSRATIYSSAVGYVSAFFGGPVGAGVVATVNARRLDRLRKDWWILPLALLVTLAYVAWLVRGGGIDWLEQNLGGGKSMPKTVLGIAMFALTHRVHRTYYRNMEVLGLDPPSGWKLGLLAILAGVASIMFCTFLVALL